MNSIKSLETLYNLIAALKSPQEAKTFVSEVLYDAIDEIQSEKLQVTEVELEKRLSKLAQDFLKASKNHVA